MTKPFGIAVAVRSGIDAPAAAVRPVYSKVLHELQSSGRSQDLSLDLAGDLQIPLELALHVPAQIAVSGTPDSARFDLTISAAVRHDYYPHFSGSIVLVERDRRCDLLLDGAYAVPFGAIGKTVDMTFLRGAAVRSLQRFLDRLADEIGRRLRAEEEAYVQRVLRFHV